MKRAIVWTLATLVLLLLLLLAATGWLLGSDSGTRTLLRQLDSLVPGLTIGSSKGDLLGQLELEQIKLEWAAGLLDIDRLLLRWSPLKLLDRAVVVEELSANGLNYSVKSVEQGPTEPLQWPIELPNLTLPISVDIGKLTIDNASFITAPEAEPIQLDNAELVARWDKAGVTIDTLDASGPNYKIAISGQLNPTGDYALSIDNQLQLTWDGDRQLDLEGNIVGNRHSLQLEQILSGAASAGLSLNLRRPLVEPGWTGRINLVKLPASLLGTSLPIDIQGKLISSGSWPDTRLSGELETASTLPEYDRVRALIEGDANLEQLSGRLSKLELSRHQLPVHLSLQGEMAADKTLNISGDWSDLQWPLVGEPAFTSAKGKLAFDGTPGDYHFDADAQITLPGIPDGRWQLSGNGDQQRVSLEALQGQLLQGEIEANGEFAWAPSTSWTLSARGRGLQASSLVPELDTSLGFSATSEGSIDDSGPSLQVILQDLSGTLNAQPVTGSGEFKHHGERTDVSGFRLRVGSAAAQANGMLGPKSNLKWSLQVPAAQELLPAARGRLSFNGSVAGPVSAPAIRAKLAADGLDYGELAMSQLAADIGLDLQDKQPSSLNLDGTGLVVAGQAIETLQLQLEGFVRDHSIRLTASQPEDAKTAAKLVLAARGGYADALWRGTLETLAIAANPAGDWRLQKPFALTAGAASASAKRFCLRQQGGASLCAEGAWHARGESSGEFELSGLPLAQFAEYFPDTISKLGGELSAEGKLQQKQNINALIKAKVSAGDLVVQDASGKALQLDHKGVELELTTAGKGVEGWLRSQVGTTILKANAKLPDVVSVTDKNQARLEGYLQLAAPDLELVSSLVPAITAITGTASADFKVTGKLGEPVLRGHSTVDVNRLEIEQLGWDIDDASLNIKADGKRLQVDGGLVSRGRLAINGELGLSAEQGWPLAMTVSGENFALTDLPNLQVFVSPDLKIRHTVDGFSLTGKIVIPEAEIIVRDLPAGAISPSGDVVVKRDDGTVRKVESTALIATNIEISLGEAVQVSALGFDGYIDGKLRLRGKPSRELLATGDVRVKEGTFRAYGQRLEIERGLISYANSPVDNPGINIRATRQIGDVLVGADALGTARRLTVKTFSSPSMSENDRISYLVAGKPAREGASLSLEREIAKNLTVGLKVDTKTGESSFVTRYRILRTLYVEVGSSARSSSLDLFYTLETD